MGSFASRISASGKLSNSKYKVPSSQYARNGGTHYVIGQNPSITFSYIIKQIPFYKDIIDTSMPFDIYIFHKELHWFLFLKPSKSSCPFLTIEITTDKHRNDLFARMDLLDDVLEKEFLKTEFTNLVEICNVADGVKEKMNGYHLLNSNCQHFCNNIVRWLGLNEFPTTTNIVADRASVSQDQLGFDAWPVIEENRRKKEGRV